jgi:hypothetical protein
VSKLRVAWRLPLKHAGVFGYYANTPVFGEDGTIYLQDLAYNVFAVDGGGAAVEADAEGCSAVPKSSADPGLGVVVGRAKAPMDVVVDHADVLHERVDTRRSDEAVPLRLQLLRERLRLRGRLG